MVAWEVANVIFCCLLVDCFIHLHEIFYDTFLTSCLIPVLITFLIIIFFILASRVSLTQLLSPGERVTHISHVTVIQKNTQIPDSTFLLLRHVSIWSDRMPLSTPIVGTFLPVKRMNYGDLPSSSCDEAWAHEVNVHYCPDRWDVPSGETDEFRWSPLFFLWWDVSMWSDFFNSISAG